MSKTGIAQTKTACEMAEPPSAKDATKSLEVLNTQVRELEIIIGTNMAELLEA